MSPSQLVEQIRQEIFESTQLTASAGIACNRTLSKICSDINKPNGQYYLPIDSKPAILNFVKDLRIRQFPGVGRVTERGMKKKRELSFFCKQGTYTLPFSFRITWCNEMF